MTPDWSQIVRPAVWHMQAYASARSAVSRLTEPTLLLDANEALDGVYARYPEPQPAVLISLLANLYQSRPETMLVGRGADEAIELLIRATCRPGLDQILQCPPTYGMYQVSAAANDVAVQDVLLDQDQNGFALNADRLLAAAKAQPPKLVFICRPNNPTGECPSLASLAKIARGLPRQSLLVIDEAYIEFADQQSAVGLIDQFPNVVVLRTLSKAFAAAGLRIGTIVANATLIALLQKIRAPYPIAQPVVDAALPLLSTAGLAVANSRIEEIRQERSSWEIKLSQMPGVQAVYPSAANFLLLKVTNATAVCAMLRARGIVLRDRSTERGLQDSIRITVGDRAALEQLLAAWPNEQEIRNA